MNSALKRLITAHQGNPAVVILTSLLFPRPFLMSFYENNRGGGRLWNGRKSCLTISFDCDYPRDVEAIPEILAAFKGHYFKTCFACVGHWIEKYPAEHRMILDEGHEIMNHTWSHPDNELLNPGRKFRYIPRAEKLEEITRCHDICKRLLNYEPSGARIPHFKHLFTPDIYGILKDAGYRYSSSTWLTNTPSNGLPYTAEHGIIEFPLSTCPKHPFTVFDTWHSLASTRLFYKLIHRTQREYLDLFKTLIDVGIETNSYMNIYIDPYDLTQMREFKGILKYLDEKRDSVWVATYREILQQGG